ncbi:MAG: Nucleotidyltransferase domain protein [Candidatus Scalindua rubra]|uniref:Nucleotidyltransferase domain protein n=1 Tax=Candidatus Scalindua rubra TaxID=1872076 RepID=A0A1E3XDK6_9BACT|nr:MAG: Nucleotidyltransferase domain protein [Candidatus Scalindua rubra]
MNKRRFEELPRIEVTDKLLEGVVHKIVEHFHPLKIIFFGSYIWGKPGQDSDVDLLVIMESKERPASRASALRRICRPMFLPMDILVRTPQEIQKRLELNDLFIKTIMEKGK